MNINWKQLKSKERDNWVQLKNNHWKNDEIKNIVLLQNGLNWIISKVL